MKSLNISTGGHRAFYNDDLSHINESVQEVQQGILSMFPDSAVYLTNTTVTKAGDVHSCGAGWMMYKGELCQFDAQNVDATGVGGVDGYTVVWEPVVTYRSLDPLAYADASSKSPHKIKKVRLYAYGNLDFVVGQDFVDYTSAKSRGLGLLNISQGSFTNLTLQNGWIDNLSNDKIKSRLDADNKVVLRGSFKPGTLTSQVFATLPAGSWPTVDKILPVVAKDNTPTRTILYLEISSTTGEMKIMPTFEPAYTIYLDGLFFYI